MNFRLKEGGGEAFYRIGYEDNGNNLGLSFPDFYLTIVTLCYISNELNVEIILDKILKGKEGNVAHIMVRKKIRE